MARAQGMQLTAGAFFAQVIGDWVAARTLDEVLAAMKEARVPSGPILSSEDIYHEAQFRERGMFHRARPPDGALCSSCAVVLGTHVLCNTSYCLASLALSGDASFRGMSCQTPCDCPQLLSWALTLQVGLR